MKQTELISVPLLLGFPHIQTNQFQPTVPFIIIRAENSSA